MIIATPSATEEGQRIATELKQTQSPVSSDWDTGLGKRVLSSRVSKLGWHKPEVAGDLP